MNNTITAEQVRAILERLDSDIESAIERLAYLRGQRAGILLLVQAGTSDSEPDNNLHVEVT